MMNNDRGRGGTGPKKTFQGQPAFGISPAMAPQSSAPAKMPDRCKDPVINGFVKRDSTPKK